MKIEKPIEEERRVSNNPFDDNELFGQEFDRIRHETTVQGNQNYNYSMLDNPNNNHKSNSCSNINYYANYYLMSNPNLHMLRPQMSFVTNQQAPFKINPKNNY